ncbi:DUF6265 family protein [Flavobacterium sp. 25HG05S-40]|uniref:DUF6265 family protein n=1 Tax=Flavobacterium sp. 25HG05S-40 TaxID=3458682 RepID=UPI0040446B34
MKKLVVLLSIVLVTSCQQKSVNKFEKINQANWFLGEWNNKSKDSEFTEIWKKATDSSYVAESFVLVNKDTVFYEKIDLMERNDNLFYIVSVRNQNNEKPVAFYATLMAKDSITFENPKHDFPNKIVYRKIENDSMIATIYGKNHKPEFFPMKKKR